MRSDESLSTLDAKVGGWKGVGGGGGEDLRVKPCECGVMSVVVFSRFLLLPVSFPVSFPAGTRPAVLFPVSGFSSPAPPLSGVPGVFLRDREPCPRLTREAPAFPQGLITPVIP